MRRGARSERRARTLPSHQEMTFISTATRHTKEGQVSECVFVSEFRVGWQLDPELLISSGDAQVSRSAVATATVSGVL